VPDEGARLEWLAAIDVPAPRVVARAHEHQRHWLLMSALGGHDLASSPELAPDRICAIAAAALRRLHRLDVAACPFDQRLDRHLALARARMDAGVVDESDFDDERQGRRAADLFEQLLACRPRDEDPVVAHGDACLPNIMAENGVFTGFVDCARLGIADRYQDLSLAARSIQYDLGEAWVAAFFAAYGSPIEPDRMAFYRLLDEFF
jgi:aminoglycoside 3'-phosphotransferase-2